MLSSQPFVSEIAASNASIWRDGFGDASDWVEIHNPTGESISLRGWHLTDDHNAPGKWQFPDVMLAPAGHLVVFASGRGGVDPRGNFHTNFRLNAGGEYLALVAPDLRPVHELLPGFPTQYADITYGFSINGERLVGGYCDDPTPGRPNSTTRGFVTLNTVQASEKSGTFTTPFALELSTGSPTGRIHYTLDGTIPTLASPVYSTVLSIQTTTTVQARVIETDSVPGPILSNRYVRLAGDLTNTRSNLPLVLIDNFGAGTVPNPGWNQTNASVRQVPRQAATMQLWEPDPTDAFLRGPADRSQPIGIRVRGAYSSTFPQPGYSIETWKDRPESAVDVPLLGMEPASDWVLYAPNPSFDEALIDNTLSFELDRALGHWSPDYRYVELYLNTDGGDVTRADYQGLYILIEKVERGPGRVDFEEFTQDATKGGWLLSINRMDPISETGTPPKNFHTAGPNGILQTRRDLANSSGVGDDIPSQYNAYINFEHPAPQDVTDVQRNSIEQWFQRMEDVLYGRVPETPWNDPAQGYSKYLDVDSFIDYLILSNLSKNGDALLLSLWIYNPDPQGTGKLTMGPMWDVDLGSFSGDPRTETMRNANQLWYGKLFRDPDFNQRYTDRWSELRRGPLATAALQSLIDRTASKVGAESARRDGLLDWSNRLSAMKTWLATRADAIDRSLILPPVFSPEGPTLPAGPGVRVSSPTGDIYVTTDGSDPRLSGGLISPTAQRVTSDAPLSLTHPTLLTARVQKGTRWSPIASRHYTPTATIDLNQDGRVDSGDIDRLATAIRKGLPEGDWNLDGQGNTSDLRDLLRTGWNSSFGDANLDGVFDSADLVRTLIAGRYEAIDGALASWTTGDWNGDGVFNSSDFVLALSEGQYQGESLAASPTPAEPSSPEWAWASLALATFDNLTTRRKATPQR